ILPRGVARSEHEHCSASIERHRCERAATVANTKSVGIDMLARRASRRIHSEKATELQRELEGPPPPQRGGGRGLAALRRGRGRASLRAVSRAHLLQRAPGGASAAAPGAA